MGSSGPYVADAIDRPLTADERAQLSARLTAASAVRRAALGKAAISSLLVCGVLAILTRAASNADWWIILLFWSALGLVFTLWIGVPAHRMMQEHESMLSDALRASRARVWRVQSERVVEFEEEEDEGACYAFDYRDQASVFIVGQQFYEDDDFPNSDFSIIDLLGTHGRPVDSILVKTGRKLVPARVVPADTKRLVQLPDHLTVVGAPLERVEAALPMARS
jgi:hypothetical protein